MVKTTTTTGKTLNELPDPFTVTDVPTTATTTGKTLAQIEAALAQSYSGTLKELEGYSYIPWNDATDAANAIFGAGGYDVEIIKTWREDTPTDELSSFPQGYAAIVRVTVHPSDADSFYRDGLGFSELVFTKARSYTDRSTGQMVDVAPRPLIDSAIKGVVSRALVRALALFGDAFGLFLYDKEDTQASTGAAPRSTTTGGDTRTLSEKQVAFVLQKCGRLGLTQEKVNTIPYTTAKKLIDALFAGTAPRQALIDAGIEVTEAPTTADRLPIPAGR